MFPIVDRKVLAPTITKLEIKAPFIARKRKAGNFVMVRVEEGGERIPLTIADGDPSRGTITLIVQAIGGTTKLLCSKNAGDMLLDVAKSIGRSEERMPSLARLRSEYMRAVHQRAETRGLPAPEIPASSRPVSTAGGA